MTDQLASSDRALGADPEPTLPQQRSRAYQLRASQRSYLRLRRVADVLLAGTGLVVGSVPMAMVALGVMATMGRPVIFTQDRITRDGRIFRLRKFRSMRSAGPDPSAEGDADRLVPFGRFIRATSLDELPSLWNILRGDMSLIGPRPLTTDYLGRFSAEQFTRHAVPAGLTGYAQVNGRNAVGWDDRLQMDQDYVRRLGPRLDAQILLTTVLTVLRRDGVTDEGGVSMADFPGPQSTSQLELQGLDADGEWVCHDRADQIVLHGALELDGTAAKLELRPGGGPKAGYPELVDDALLLVLSRLRAHHPVDWACITASSDLPEEIATALRRLGFGRASSAVRWTRTSPPPGRALDGDAALVGFIGFPDEVAS